jgi:hypothetical protein
LEAREGAQAFVFGFFDAVAVPLVCEVRWEVFAFVFAFLCNGSSERRFSSEG